MSAATHRKQGLKTSSLWFKTILLVIVVATAAYLIHWQRNSWRHKKDGQLLAMGDVSRLEILHQGQTFALRKPEKAWKLESINGQPVRDDRVVQGRVEKILDLLRSLREEAKKDSLDPKLAPEYGLSKPNIAISLGWDKPSPGEEAILFGNSELSKNRIYVFLPKELILTLTKPALPLFLSQKPVGELRDRHLSTFSADDVEELISKGNCAALHLYRDGDRWLWKSKSPKGINTDQATNEWLKNLLELSYERVDETETTKPAKTACVIQLKGRLKREEQLNITQGLWITNTALSAKYLAPKALANILSIKE